MLKYTGSDGDDTYIYHPDRASADITNVREGLWNLPNTGATNETGFSALPGGERSKSGKDKYISFVTSFWSSTELKEEEKTNIESWYKDDPIAWYWKIGYSGYYVLSLFLPYPTSEQKPICNLLIFFYFKCLLTPSI